MPTTSFTVISQDIKNALYSKSAANLPDEPSASGLKAQDIKNAMVAPVLDKSVSLLTLLEKLIEECEENRNNIESRLAALEEPQEVSE